MGNLISWGMAHWGQLLEAIAAIVGAASVIVKLTPTLKDDNVVLPIVKFVAKYVALNKEKPTERPS